MTTCTQTQSFDLDASPGDPGPTSGIARTAEVVIRLTREAWRVADVFLSRSAEPMPTSDSTVLDCSDFPLVRLVPAAIRPGFAFRWRAEMERLLALRACFVLIYPPQADGEVADDSRVRGCWMRKHRHLLDLYCRGAIIMEPIVTKRLQTRARALELHARSIRIAVIADARNVQLLARVLLKSNAKPYRPASQAGW